MLQVIVKDCGKCPFAGESNLGFPTCCHPDIPEDGGSYFTNPPRAPDWCPLRVQAVIVKLDGPPGKR